MTDKFEEIVDNLKRPSHWVRLPFMLAYGFILYLIFVPVVIVVMAAQILFALITGQSNRNLRGLASVVQQYVSQIIDYITYNSNERPFPFSDFPDEDISVVENFDFERADPAVKDEDSDLAPDPKPGEEKTQPKVVKKTTKAKKSTAKSKIDTASASDTPSAAKKPARKKVTAAASKPSDSDAASTQADSPTEATDSEPS
ncbi:MAG: cytoskeletal protein RodZ [Pseudohongiellaceae bacterium]|jgi:cytoskeletal protein RodZ